MRRAAHISANLPPTCLCRHVNEDVSDNINDDSALVNGPFLSMVAESAFNAEIASVSGDIFLPRGL